MSQAGEKTITVDKSDYETLQRIKAIMDKGFNDKSPKGAAFRRQLKDIEPSLNIPDEYADAVAAPIKEQLTATEANLKALQDRLDARDKADADSREDAQLQTAIEKAVKKYGLDDEGQAAVIKRLIDMKSTDAEAAAAWFKSTLPAPKVTRDSGIFPQPASVKDVFGAAEGVSDDDLALLHGNDPFKFFDKVTTEILNEPASA